MAEKQMDELKQIFPMKLRQVMEKITWDVAELEEIRIRIGQPVQFITAGDYFYVDPIHSRKTESAEAGIRLFAEDLQEMMTYLCEYSRYAYAKQLRQGYLTLPGGIRVGVCGQYMAEGTHLAMEYPMFFSIRIPHEKKGCANWVVPWLFEKERFLHTLILAAPGVGKTTCLRDILRLLSNRANCRGIALLDERYEVASVNFGVPQNDVGMHTDVYSGYEKEAASMQAIRTMAPQVLALDEIGGEKDLQNIAYAMRCGIGILATMHAGSVSEYWEKRSMQPWMAECAFLRLLWMEKEADGRRMLTIYNEMGDVLCTKHLV